MTVKTMAGAGISERHRLDGLLTERIDSETRTKIWSAADEVLATARAKYGRRQSSTGLALGYVQSGKTTAMTALMAAAADEGYRVIIAFLGSTNLLLGQNETRIHRALGVETRNDYRWVAMRNPSGVSGISDLRDWLRKGRVVLLSVLKHAGRIDHLAGVVRTAIPDDMRVLLVDDEADQASLNTRVNEDEESKIYAAIRRLRADLPLHLYVQYTATPYAPLLLEPEDHLLPDFVSFLHPGPGYTGGREFFVDHEKQVIRAIPTLDEQPPKKLPTELPKSLVAALANYIAGAAILLQEGKASPPISMLIHSTQRNDVQARYFFLLERLLRQWRAVSKAAKALADFPPEITVEHERLLGVGAARLAEPVLLARLKYVLAEIKPWLVNSQTSVAKINWNVAPCHIVMGGNKLDRGFTVEGLTVTYMNRATTTQIDTLEQRARAFGYRSDLLPYCQFFATPRTLKVLKDVVFTEYDLRARLQDWLASGGSVQSWAHEVGLMLPEGSKPSRENVLQAMNVFNSVTHWHALRRPSLDPATRRANFAALQGLGVLTAPYEAYGRLKHRTLRIDIARLVAFIRSWQLSSYSPDWRHQDIVDFLERRHDIANIVTVMLLELEPNLPRSRDWDKQTGFVNIFQGPDPVQSPDSYPGDRYVMGLADDSSPVVLQIHHVQPKQMAELRDLYTLAVHLGDRVNIRRSDEGEK